MPGPERDLEPGTVDTDKGTRYLLLVFVILVVGVRAAEGCVMIIASQLLYSDGVAQTPGAAEWLFFAVTAMPNLAGSMVGLAGAGYDQYFDKSFGIASAVHFRLVGASVILCATLLTVALVPHGITQVILAFVVAFLAASVFYAAVQFVAVLDPAATSWMTFAGTLAVLIPMGTVWIGLDTHKEWDLLERMLLFAPTIALNVASVGALHLAWPRELGERSGTSTAAASRSSSAGELLALRLTDGLDRLHGSEKPPSVLANLGKFAPAPYYWCTVFGMVNSFTGIGLVMPLIGHVAGSGAQATLILARFWGEIIGQVTSTVAATTGWTNATVPDLVLQGVLTAARLAMTVYMISHLLGGALHWGWMLVFRLIDTYVWSTTTVMIGQACSTNQRRDVVRNGLWYVNSAGLAGLVCCMALMP